MRALKHTLLALLLVSCGQTKGNPRPSANYGNAAGESAVDDTAGGAAPHPGGNDAGGNDLTGADGAMAGRANGVGGAESAPASAGMGGQSAPDAIDPLDSPGPNVAVCDAYLAAWRLRSTQESGDAGPCYQCMGNQPACFEAVEVITEGQRSCFARHCLCDPVSEDCAVFPYPTDVCACFASCLPVAPHPARQSWLDYMTCEVESCADACR